MIIFSLLGYILPDWINETKWSLRDELENYSKQEMTPTVKSIENDTNSPSVPVSSSVGADSSEPSTTKTTQLITIAMTTIKND